jgi:processive 1,2-diacylglycerol beta-glucosyltransferase
MNAKPRVLLLSASSGAGHVRAAQALEKIFAARADCIVEHIDAINHVSKLFQRIYDKAYISMVRNAPEFMGLLYDRTDQPWNNMRRRLTVDLLNSQPLIRAVRSMQPDLCVATHFLPGEILAWLIAKKKLRSRSAIVITDYDVHALWLCRTVIPIDPQFAVPADRTATRERLGLDPNAPVVLVSAGGEGVGPVEQLVRGLLAIERPWQIVAICGKSEKMRRHLEQLLPHAGARRSGAARLHVVGFTKEMDQYMAAASLLVGKAGGLTTSEALARGLPMALIEPIPGQEERNADHLLEAGVAIRCNNFPVAPWKISRLLDDSARLKSMQEAARLMARPNAAASIAQDALALVNCQRPA